MKQDSRINGAFEPWARVGDIVSVPQSRLWIFGPRERRYVIAASGYNWIEIKPYRPIWDAFIGMSG